MLIRVVTLANLINKINLMPNCTLIIFYIVVLSYTLVSSLLNAKNLAIFCCKLFKCSYIDYYAYKVVCSIAGYKYSCIIDKGVLVGYKRYYIVYSCN